MNNSSKYDLPTILSFEEAENTATWQLDINADKGYFDGHFPEQAVLPGVTQLDWVIKLACVHFGITPSITRLEVLKFQQLILPNTRLSLSVTYLPAKAKLSFSYSAGDKRYSSGRLVINSQSDNH